MGRRVIQRFDLIVDRNRNYPRLARDVAADHQHDAELTQRVSKAQHNGIHKTVP